MFALMETLNGYIWISDFVVLCILATIAFKENKNNSSLLTQAFIVLISGVLIKYQDLVNGFSDPYASQSTLNLWLGGFVFYDAVVILILVAFYKSFLSKYEKALRLGYIGLTSLLLLNIIYVQFVPLLFDTQGLSFKVWILIAFYFGIALLAGFAVYAINKLHRFFNLTHSLIARMYMLAFAVVAILQIARFSEKFLWHSNAGQTIYQFSLASINISTSIVALFITVVAVYQRYIHRSQAGVMWKI